MSSRPKHLSHRLCPQVGHRWSLPLTALITISFLLTAPSQSEEWTDFTQNIVILAVILLMIAILIAIICKILHKIRDNLSEEYDGEETDNKSEESLQYVDNREDDKTYANYRTHNGVLPQDLSQTNSTTASGQPLIAN